MIRVAVLDVDGTITERDRKIGAEVMRALPEAQDSGVVVSLVSGNVIPVMYALRTFLGTKGPVFGENGGVMLKENEVEMFFTPDIPKKYFEYLKERISIDGILTNRWRETSVAFAGQKDEIARELENIPYKWSKLVEVVDSTYAWHIMNKGENKAFAVNKIHEMYSLAPDEVLVVGDSDNDYPMYETGSVKAAVHNSTDRIKEKCDYVSKESHGKGVVDILTHYGLIGRR